MAILAINAHALIIFLYTNKWVECVPYFQILCIAGVAISMQGVLYYAVASLGKSRELFIWTIIKRGLALLVILAGTFSGGIYGLLIGTVLSSWIVYLSNAYLCSKHIHYTFTQQLLDLSPIVIANLISYLISYYIGSCIVLPIYLESIIVTTIYLAVYLLISYFIKIKPLIDVYNILNNQIKRLL